MGGRTNNPLLQHQITASSANRRVECEVCRDAGVILLTASLEMPSSAETVRQSLQSGDGCLCTCESGQFWLSFLYSVREISGNPVPTNGVPDGLIPGADWLEDRLSRRRRAAVMQ